jgi:hypothetical protein
MMPPHAWLTVYEAAAALSWTVVEVKEECELGNLDAHQRGNDRWFVLGESINRTLLESALWSGEVGDT